jgi:hypothetical protein
VRRSSAWRSSEDGFVTVTVTFSDRASVAHVFWTLVIVGGFAQKVAEKFAGSSGPGVVNEMSHPVVFVSTSTVYVWVMLIFLKSNHAESLPAEQTCDFTMVPVLTSRMSKQKAPAAGV